MATYLREVKPRRVRVAPVAPLRAIQQDDVPADAWVRKPDHASAWWKGSEPQSPTEETAAVATFTRWANGSERDARGILVAEAHGFLEAKALGQSATYRAPNGDVIDHVTCSTEYGKPHWVPNEAPRRLRKGG